MNKYIIITARSSSTRLNKKILKKVTDKDRCIDILIKRAQLIGMPICLATTTDSSDNKLLSYVKKKYNIVIFRGNKENKVARWYKCFRKLKIDIAGFVDGDDLAFDYELYKYYLSKLKKNNIHSLKFPRKIVTGSFTYIFTKRDIIKLYKLTKKMHSLDVIEFYVKKIKNIKNIKVNKILINKNIRLTMDYEKDLLFFKKLYTQLSILEQTQKIIFFLEKNKKIKKINYFLNTLWKKNQLKEIKFHEKKKN